MNIKPINHNRSHLSNLEVQRKKCQTQLEFLLEYYGWFIMGNLLILNQQKKDIGLPEITPKDLF